MAVNFPIDLVYTWVDGYDIQWQTKRQQWEQYRTKDQQSNESTTDARWRNMDELRHSIESSLIFAPWIRNIYIITDNQKPQWFDSYSQNIQNLFLVDHATIFKGFENHLPTFNSHALESQMYRIPGLAEHFIYSNDDMLFGNYVQPQDFFTPDGKAQIFLSTQNNMYTDESQFSQLDREQNSLYIIAHNNTQTILNQFIGEDPNRKRLKHQMKPLRKSVFEFCWETNPTNTALFGTSGSRFRSFTDIEPCSLISHTALTMELAVSSSISSVYYSFDDRIDLKRIFRDIRRRRSNFPKLYCLNDNLEQKATPQNIQVITHLLNEFLPHQFVLQ